ncbi:MAG: FtsX-like permease family protein [Ferruginibacter sp.]|nr:FtsX-like permease family protein [Ferruginibacter sp.]
MYFRFAWRYFKAKKSANAINIIAWVTTIVIAFATCCQLLVLSVFNGFEGLVKSLYSSFYSDIRIIPAAGKTFALTNAQIDNIGKMPFNAGMAMIAEEKALLQNGEQQTVVSLKGVDKNYVNISGVASNISAGNFDVGSIDTPKLVVGYGVQNAASINMSEAFPATNVTLILPKKSMNATAEDAMSEGNAAAAGVFTIQQEIDNQYAITNIDFVKQQMGFGADEYSAAEIKLKEKVDVDEATTTLQNILGKDFKVQTRFEQNANLYNTMRLEKWAIYAVLTLILIIAAFNMVSALTMLVLEKRKDISILRSMGTTKASIRKIFLAEGLLLGVIGAATGIVLALLICVLQIKFHIIKISGGSFLIDYFPVKLIGTDFLMVAATAISIAFLASWFPAGKAAQEKIELK